MKNNTLSDKRSVAQIPDTPIKVLIAEDNPVVAKTIEIALNKINCRCLAKAMDGEQAKALTIKHQPDVVLMDINMPKLNGLEATKQILEHYSVPVVIITSADDQKVVEAASDAGAAAFLVKPPRPQEIERAITIALARHHDLQELKRLNAELQEALSELKTLRGILPICAACKKIRDDTGYWQQIESYISQRSEALFSHGICPECVRKLYPDIADDIDFS